MPPTLLQLLLVLSLLLALIFSLRIGFRLGSRAKEQPEGKFAQVGTIQGATLSLLALLLGFSFSGASSRFHERQALITDLANAIDTTRLRADLLTPDPELALKTALQDFTQTHLEVSALFKQSQVAQAESLITTAHTKLWSVASNVVYTNPPLQMTLLIPLNQTLDLSSKRIALARNHLPIPILILLVGSATLSLGILGFGCGLARQRHTLLTHALLILIAAALWTTLDLDFPRIGFIQVNDQPLLNLYPSR